MLIFGAVFDQKTQMTAEVVHVKQSLRPQLILLSMLFHLCWDLCVVRAGLLFNYVLNLDHSLLEVVIDQEKLVLHVFRVFRCDIDFNLVVHSLETCIEPRYVLLFFNFNSALVIYPFYTHVFGHNKAEICVGDWPETNASDHSGLLAG